jgi:DNA-binding SARP family transcriptional activator
VARLLAVLALVGPMSRAQATGLLWPGADAAHGSANLRSTLARVNTVTHGFVETSGNVLALTDGVHTDVEDALDWIHATIYAATSQAVSGAPPPSIGKELLPGWEEDWLEEPRERLRLLQTQALETAAERLLAGGRPAEAFPYALSAVQAQPWSESANRLLIEIHARRGDPSNALRRYRRFHTALETELGVQPGPDMIAVIRQIYPFGIAMADQLDRRPDKPTRRPRP